VDLRPAAGNAPAIGAFNVIQLEHAEAIVAAAELTGTPVILQLSENTVTYHGTLAPMGRALLEIAAHGKVPIGVHLDHATDPDLVAAAVELGFDSVMYDASALPHEENVKRTKDVVRFCHGRQVWVEAELGEIGGKDGVHAPGVRTDPGEAARYVEETGVDALAVAVGSSHAMLTRDARLDFDLITALHAVTPVPLVLHGSSGVPDDQLARAVQAGMWKINIATQLNKVFTKAVRTRLGDDTVLVDPRRYLGAGRESVIAEVARLIGILNGRPVVKGSP